MQVLDLRENTFSAPACAAFLDVALASNLQELSTIPVDRLKQNKEKNLDLQAQGLGDLEMRALVRLLPGTSSKNSLSSSPFVRTL